MTPVEPPKVGDIVETKIGKKWVRVVVEQRYAWKGISMLRVRRERHHTNYLCPQMSRYPGELRPVTDRPSSDPLSANIYADWLEENDFPEAAAALRKAFPFSEGVPHAR